MNTPQRCGVKGCEKPLAYRPDGSRYAVCVDHLIARVQKAERRSMVAEGIQLFGFLAALLVLVLGVLIGGGAGRVLALLAVASLILGFFYFEHWQGSFRRIWRRHRKG
jgi:hypothetical protein